MKENPLYKQIEQHYLKRITDGELKQGDRLPTEYEMMKIFGVSRITVIKAMKGLEKHGVIERHTKTGTFVNTRKREITKQLTIPIVLPYNDVLNYDIILGAQKFALANGAVIPFYNTFNKPTTEREILMTLEHMNLDGLIFYPCSTLENIDAVSRIYRKKIPIVLLDRPLLGADFPLVTSDNFTGMRRLVRHLLRKGYRRFGYYGISKQMIATERDRFDGFCSGLFDSNLEINPAYFYENETDVAESSRYASSDCRDENVLLASKKVAQAIKQDPNPPQVVCCTNDFYAVTLLKAVQEEGISVPDDLIITGFDGISLTRNSDVPIPTISQNFEEIGKTALVTICRMIAGESVPSVQKIPTHRSRADRSWDTDTEEEE